LEAPEDSSYVRNLYQVLYGNEEFINLNVEGEVHLGSPMFVGQSIYVELYEWKMENDDSRKRECWSFEAILKDNIQIYFLVKEIPFFFKRKIRHYPILIPIESELACFPPLRFKERESPYIHLE